MSVTKAITLAPTILSALGKIKDKVIGGDVVPTIESEIIKNTGVFELRNLKSFLVIKNILIFFTVVWAFSMIISRFFIKEEKTKKDIEFVNTTLFGNSGAILVVVILWIAGLLLSTILPQVLSILPKIGETSGFLGNVFKEVATVIPALVT